jgi:hypothetical protein
MTIETFEPQTLVTTTAQTGANLIREAAAVMADAHKLATAVASTQMIPKHFQGKPDECAAAMLYGASLGLDPMQSVRQIYVVHGQAALYARAMVALVMGAGHEVWTVESNDDSVTVAGRRRGTENAEISTWTYDRAKKAGYTSNDKYRTDPQAMLYSKAASEVCRKIAPDVLSGVYAVEELQMERVESVRVDQGRGLAALMTSTAPAAPPVAEEPATTAELEAMADAMPAPESPLLNTSSKLARAMYAGINEAGISEPNRINFICEVIGRDIASTKEMTDDEARRVLDHLPTLPQEGPQ